MFVAVIVLLINGQPIVERHSEQHFTSVSLEHGCESWLQRTVPALGKEIAARGLHFDIQTRCDCNA